VYLISLEIMNNSLHHGKATSVIIELYGYKNKFIFQYTDNGTGFDTKITPKGFGLENIENECAITKESSVSIADSIKGPLYKLHFQKRKSRNAIFTF